MARMIEPGGLAAPANPDKPSPLKAPPLANLTKPDIFRKKSGSPNPAIRRRLAPHPAGIAPQPDKT
jgi:hypothetical protein